MHQNRTEHLPAITPLNWVAPEGFPFATNTGNHGNVLLFEVGGFQLLFTGAHYVPGEPELVYRYESTDSDEGRVEITYYPHGGGDPIEQLNEEPGLFDVGVQVLSECWSLEDGHAAVWAVIQLHRALGHALRAD